MMQKQVKRKTFFSIQILKKHSGFTLVELLVAMILLTILILIGISLYLNFINKAKVTVAENVLRQARDQLNLYHIDNNKFPYSINFSSNCVDESSLPALPQGVCDQLKQDLYSTNYSYTAATQKYILTGRAQDNKHTLITVTPEALTK
jgi:prepilin-type N-terminal cleavage/methylation domain-containing protein